MKIKHTIKKTDDHIGMSKEVTSFCDLLLTLETPVTIAINGKWGSGKTKFVDLCIHHFNQTTPEGNKTFPDVLPVYINAWENDYSEDPLLILFANILQIAQDNQLVEDEQSRAIRKEFGRLFKAVLPILIKLGTAGLFNIRSKDFDAAIEKYSESVLDEYWEERKSLDKIKELLKTLISAPKKVIVFVDELDRCNPLFSIRMLERVKHLFEISNVVFVFSVDKKQLSKSIKKVYGQGFDATGYLWRFFNLTYELPVKKSDYIEHLYDYYDFVKLLDRDKIKRTNIDYNQIMDPLQMIVAFEDISLRDCEFLVTRLHLFMKAYSKCGFTFPVLAAFLLTLYHFKRDLYESYFDPERDISELTDYVRKMHSGAPNQYICPRLTATLVHNKGRFSAKAVSGFKSQLIKTLEDTTILEQDKEFEKSVHQNVNHYSTNGIGIDPVAFRQSIEQLEYWTR